MTTLKSQQDNFIFYGKIYWKGEITEGYVLISNGRIEDFMEEYHHPDIEGIMLPKFFNAHIHILDSSADKEPPRELLKAVGKDGYKWKFIDNPNWNSYRKTLKFMKNVGIGYYVEFHESPYAKMAKKISKEENVGGIILGRIKEFPDGVGWSTALGKPPKTNGFLGLHHSEGYHEDIEIALSYEPHHLVHLNHATRKEIKKCVDEDIPIVITPRSYLYFSLPLRIKEFIELNAKIMLGTDNCMVSSPDLRVETEIFWKLSSLNTKEILDYIYLPYKEFLGIVPLNIKSRDWIIFEEKNIYKLIRNFSFYLPFQRGGE